MKIGQTARRAPFRSAAERRTVERMEDVERPSALPLALYAVVGVLAVIGAFTIFGTVVGILGWLLKAAIALGVVYLLFKGISAVRSDRRAEPSDSVSRL